VKETFWLIVGATIPVCSVAMILELRFRSQSRHLSTQMPDVTHLTAHTLLPPFLPNGRTLNLHQRTNVSIQHGKCTSRAFHVLWRYRSALNKDYKAAQQIFQGPTSIAFRSGVMTGYRMLYVRSTRNGFGVIETLEDVYDVLRGSGRTASPLTSQHHVKPAVYV
jgi:hypothetical protein